MEKCNRDDLEKAHKASIYHRGSLTRNSVCGCFHCLRIFPPALIIEWTDDGDTAICPHCAIDAVLGDSSGFPMNREFLRKMKWRWFREK